MNSIPHELLIEYVTSINAMEMARGVSPQLYAELDKFRQSIHDKILEFAGTNRENKAFAIALATLIEEMRDERR